MSKNGESSLLRSLAVALGEGVAFSVGMKLTDSVAKQLSGGPAEQPAALPATGALDLRENDDRIRALVEEKVAEHFAALQSQMTQLQQNFTEAVTAIIRDEVARQVEARAKVIEEQILLLEGAAVRPSDPEPPLAETLAEWAATGPPIPIDAPRGELAEAGATGRTRRTSSPRRKRARAN